MSLLAMMPEGARHLARLRVSEAAEQPLFQALIAELRQMPQIAQRAQQIEQQCGEDPLKAVGELLVFDREEQRETLGQGSARSAEMLIQLERPASWALDCLGSVREDFARTEIGGREARRLGSLVVVSAGENLLLISHEEGALAALERLQTADATPHQVAERVQRLGNPLLFGTGAVANRMGMERAETVVTSEGDALRFQLTGDMRDAEAAASAVRRLQMGLSLAEAFIGRQAGEGADQNAQQRLRSVLQSVRIESAEDRVHVALNLPDAETQRALGGMLARLLSIGAAQRMPEQRPPEQGEPQQQPPAEGAGG